jgi:hypothetical protein
MLRREGLVATCAWMCAAQVPYRYLSLEDLIPWIHTEGVLLCTDVTARGIDIPDVDVIIQYDAPQVSQALAHTCSQRQQVSEALAQTCC